MLISHFELLPALILFALFWHAGYMLDQNVNMNMSYSYPTTMYESILAQKYVFLVSLTIFAFYHEIFKQNGKRYFSIRNMHIWAKILSYIVVG